MPSLSKAFFVGSDYVNGIVEVLDIIPSISLWAVAGPAHKVFNNKALTFFDYALIEKAINFEGFLAVGVIFHKHKRELLRAGPVKWILGRSWSWLKPSYREKKVDLLVAWYLQLVDKATNFLHNPKGANVLLG